MLKGVGGVVISVLYWIKPLTEGQTITCAA